MQAETGVEGGPPGQPAPLTALIGEVESLGRAERMDQLIAWADEFVEVSPAVAVRPFPERNRAPRCESEAYVFVTDRRDGTLDFHFAVESPNGISARAWAVILERGCSGQPLEQVARVPEDAVTRIFGPGLSLGKEQGLVGMLGLVTHAARRRLEARRGTGAVARSRPGGPRRSAAGHGPGSGRD